MDTDRSRSLPLLGSAFRRGREAPAYQADRLRMMFDFTARLVDVYSRQLRDQQRRGKQVWDAKLWHEGRNRSLEQALADATRTADERAGWIARLEEAKTYLEKANRDQANWIAKLEEAKAYLEKTNRDRADWIAKLEEAKAYLAHQIESLQQQLEAESKQRARLAAYLDEMRANWWWKLGACIGLLKPPADDGS